MEKRAARAQSMDDSVSSSARAFSMACPDKSAAPKMTLAVTLLTAKGCAVNAALYESHASTGDTLKDCVTRGKESKRYERKRANLAMVSSLVSVFNVIVKCCSILCNNIFFLPTRQRWYRLAYRCVKVFFFFHKIHSCDDSEDDVLLLWVAFVRPT